MRLSRSLILAVPAALIAAPVLADDSKTSGRKLAATLTGAAEVPGPGDPDGRGTAEITVNSGQNRVCYHVMVSNIAPPTAGHVHIGLAGTAGPPRVTLGAFVNGMSHGCATVPRSLAMDILKNPARYYVNVHTADFPNGAIRGQLAKR